MVEHTNESWNVRLHCMHIHAGLTSNLLSFTPTIGHTSLPVKSHLLWLFTLQWLNNHWPLGLKTCSAMPADMTNICAKFHWNPSTKYSDTVSHQTRVNGQLCLLLLIEALKWSEHDVRKERMNRNRNVDCQCSYIYCASVHRQCSTAQHNYTRASVHRQHSTAQLHPCKCA